MRKTIRRRRLEAKTDYKARLALLKSGKARLIVRKTNRYITAQLVTSNIAQDSVVIGFTSKNLLAKGWPESQAGSLKSLPAAYLTGYLLGKESKGKVSEAILDIGMHRNIQKSRLYAVLKGALDAGLDIPHGESSLPDEKALTSNKAITETFTKVKAKI